MKKPELIDALLEDVRKECNEQEIKRWRHYLYSQRKKDLQAIYDASHGKEEKK